MSVDTRTVAEDEAELRLDRWFRRHYPALSFGQLQKLLRTGQVRVDGKRAKANARLEPGQTIRVPPQAAASADAAPKPERKAGASREDRRFLEGLILYQDADVIVLDKPAGLPVQGGTKSKRNIDDLLGALAGRKGEKPRLVHRLDKDTSGVLLLAKSANAAARLGTAFRTRETLKLYWALTAGVPAPPDGEIDLALAKLPGRAGERVRTADEVDEEALDDDAMKKARTRYAVIDRAGNELAWVAFRPLTGRTHQIRVHSAALGTPILGDGKYGGRDAFVGGDLGLSKQLHLHARRLVIPHPRSGTIDVTAPLPPHMAKAWKKLGFEPRDGDEELLDD